MDAQTTETVTRVAGPLAMTGVMWLLRKIIPKVPAAAGPAINIGITLAIATFAPWLLTPVDAVISSGGAALIHNTVKNIGRGDKLGQESVPIPEGLKANDVIVVQK